MVAIRRAEARTDFGPDPSLTLSTGAHLKVKSYKIFEPKFHEETGDLWSPMLSLILEVVDDYTEDGNADGLTFADRFEFKLDEEIIEALGVEEKSLRNSNISDFNAEERKQLLELTNWTIRENTKIDTFLSCIYGKRWIEGKQDFDPEDLVDEEFIAKVQPRTGKRPGSFTDWNSYVSLKRPKKKKTSKGSDTVDLSDEEVQALEKAPF